MPTKWTPEKKRQYAGERYTRLHKTKTSDKSPSRAPLIQASERVQDTTDIIVNQQHDFWMDNAIENLFSLVKSVETSDPDIVTSSLESNRLEIKIIQRSRFLKSLERIVKSKRDSVLFVETRDKDTGAKRNIKPAYVLIQYGQRVRGKNVVKEKMFDDMQMRERLASAFLQEDGTKTCILCGSNFEHAVDNLKQSVLPSVTRSPSLSGVLRKRDYYYDLCPTCYAIGVLEWVDDRIVYRNERDGESMALYPLSPDLTALNVIKSAGYLYLKQRGLGSNISMKTRSDKDVFIQGPYSAMLTFLEKLTESISGSEDQDSWSTRAETILCREWVCMRVPSGAMKNVLIENIRLPERIMSLIRKVDSVTKDRTKSLRIYAELISSLYLREQAGHKRPRNIQELTDIMREKIAENFMKDNFHDFALQFIPRKQLNVYLPTETQNEFDRFLQVWQMNELEMTDDEFSKLKQAANLVAELNLNNISIFYGIERARNVNEFLESLRMASRKLVVRVDEFASGKLPIQPTSLDSLVQMVISKPNTKWSVVRDLLLIYVSMYYAVKKRGG